MWFSLTLYSPHTKIKSKSTGKQQQQQAICDLKCVHKRELTKLVSAKCNYAEGARQVLINLLTPNVLYGCLES